jgi:predicted DNA-binding protein
MSTATVTKSIRLSPEESEELARLSEQTATPEASLMKQWVREGMRARKIELAIQAYMQRKTDLRGGAAMAGVSYNRFLREVQAHNIVILEDDRFLERLAFLADTFEDEDLRSTIKHVLGQAPSPVEGAAAV